eukprot:Platyproteum_vivax@DN10643_c0_g1_i1.p1
MSGFRKLSSLSGRMAGWLFQQCIKLTAQVLFPSLLHFTLVLDADVLWRRPVSFLYLDSKNGYWQPVYSLVHSSSVWSLLQTAIDLHRYDAFLKDFPAVPIQKNYPKEETAVVHHMVLERHMVEQVVGTVEQFWKDFRDYAIKNHCAVSEFDLYFYSLFQRNQQDSHPRRTYVQELPFLITHDTRLQPPVAFVVSHSHLKDSDLQTTEGIVGSFRTDTLQAFKKHYRVLWDSANGLVAEDETAVAVGWDGASSLTVQMDETVVQKCAQDRRELRQWEVEWVGSQRHF